jgi:hypothetical protein
MSRPYEPPPPDIARRIAEISERRMTSEAFEELVAMPWAEGEREDLRDHIAWFMRRYPSPLERLRWVRRHYQQWSRRPIG